MKLGTAVRRRGETSVEGQIPAASSAPSVDGARAGGRDLQLIGLGKTFSDQVAVHDVSIDIREGELLVLLGPSGCGKSTTLNMIAGFLHPDSGDIRMGGESVVAQPVHRRNIGIVFQSYSLFPHMTVYDNAAFGLRRRKIAKAAVRPLVEEKLELVGMADYASRFPDQLSGGQQQRIALARALVIEPRLLLLDEPLSNLDAKLRVEMRDQIRALVTREGVTTVFVTHDQEEALTIADRVAVMHRGHLLQLGSPREIYRRPVDLTVAGFVGRSNRLTGTVVEVDRTSAVVALPSGARVRGLAGPGIAAGDAAVVIVRPESIAVSAGAADAATNSVTARLRSESFLGQSVELHFEGRDHLTAIVKDAHGIAPGDRCTLTWSTEDALVFEQDGDER